MRKIKLRMTIYNAAMALMIVALAIFDYKKYDWIDNRDLAALEMKALYCAFVLLNTLILAWSVVKIR